MNPGVDTIVSVASGWGRSERAIVRMSGAGVGHLLATFFGVNRPQPHAVAPARFLLAPGTELPCLLMTFAAPASYTGEDSAEVLVPGNPLLLERIIDRMTRLDGVREATPGEFSARAYMNARLTVEQAEGVAARISARTREQLDAADRLLSGETGSVYVGWADELATLLALVESGIDFTDQEDVVPIGAPDLVARLVALRGVIGAHVGGSTGREASDHRVMVVLAGEPNAGKSTLFNALLARRRAVTSDVAGTTRDVLVEPLELHVPGVGRLTVSLADLAGIDGSFGGEGASARVDRAAVERASEAVGRADVVIHCDPSGGYRRPLPIRSDTPVIRVRTKADLPAGGGPHAEDVSVCALDGWNLDVLRRAIVDAAWARGDAGDGALPARHRRTIDGAVALIGEAIDAASADSRALSSPELVGGALREALDLLGEITGRITPDDVIGRVFATFCVGK